MSGGRAAKGCLIGLDLGTSAIKGVLTDACGAVLAEAGAQTSLLHPCEGWVEIDPERYYQNICSIIRELAAHAPAEVSGLAMAAASGNTLLTDSDGKPVTNIINWMDRRAEMNPPAALAGLTGDAVSQVTGWPCVSCFPLAHVAWLKENQPERYRAAAHVGMDTDWVLYRLTGKWLMDHSTATTFHLQEQVAGTYYEPFLKRLGLSCEKLSTLTESGVVAGTLIRQAADDTGLSPKTKVVTGCFDHPAAARAVGVLEQGQLMLSCGTSWVGFTPHRERQAILDAKMLCDPFLSASAGAWGGMFSVPCIGRAIDWYVENVIAPGESDKLRIFDESAAQAEPGAGGLLVDLQETPQPIRASRANLSRAVMEGAARLLSEKLRGLKAHGFSYDRAVMVGGPSRSRIWPTIVAKETGLNIVTNGRSAGARGAAVLAGIGSGVYRDERAALAGQGELK
jgi:sugar (pentulose or hexulose) kinase